MSDTDMPLMRRDLFGGAMEIQMPSRLMDVSEFRPVPDNQEVIRASDLVKHAVTWLFEIVRRMHPMT